MLPGIFKYYPLTEMYQKIINTVFPQASAGSLAVSACRRTLDDGFALPAAGRALRGDRSLTSGFCHATVRRCPGGASQASPGTLKILKKMIFGHLWSRLVTFTNG
jgi:hypothetical protein